MQIHHLLATLVLMVVLIVPRTDATITGLTIAGLTFSAVPITLTTTQLAAVAGVGLLGKAAGFLGASLLSQRTSRRRGKRDVESDVKIDSTLEMLVEVEPEDCYKRILCAASTGHFSYSQVDSILSVLKNHDLRDSNYAKFSEAVRFGEATENVAKCENRYQCSLDLEIIANIA